MSDPTTGKPTTMSFTQTLLDGHERAFRAHTLTPMQKLTLRFDCKACDMHVVGKLKPAVAKKGTPLNFYRARPAA